jgi:hypothetical protein
VNPGAVQSSAESPRLSFHLVDGNLNNLPGWSAAPKGDRCEVLAEVRHAGFEGLQVWAPDDDARKAGLDLSGLGRVMRSGEAAAIAEQHKAWGFVATALHVGDGLESDEAMTRLAREVVEAAECYAYPLFIETHRATMTQDMRRTLDLVTRCPEVRFNADLSHWYTGQEMTYGDLFGKIDRLQPVFDRVRFMHGRIGNACCMQIPIARDGAVPASVAHFKEMWGRCFAAFLIQASPGDRFIFAPELLPDQLEFGGVRHEINYARRLPNGEEESDRWDEALKLRAIATQVFDHVREGLAASGR